MAKIPLNAANDEGAIEVPDLLAVTLQIVAERLGLTAACTLLNRIEHHENRPEIIEVEPEFVVRNSAARARTPSVAGFRKVDAEDINGAELASLSGVGFGAIAIPRNGRSESSLCRSMMRI
jgi:hypothetical protein